MTSLPSVRASHDRSLQVGPVLVVECAPDPCRPLASSPPWLDDPGKIAVCFPLAGEIRLGREGDRRLCRPGDVLLLNRESGVTVATSHDAAQIMLLAASPFLSEAYANLRSTGVLAGNASFDLLVGFARHLLDHEPGRLSAGQAMLAAKAIRHMLAAALVPVAGLPCPADRRRDGLLNRLSDLLDSRLDHNWEVVELCAALGRSRSALYRAAEPVNGIVELLAQRRLIAIHRTLLDPDDPRTIGEIAAAFGFPDASQFSRRFKQSFGTTPGRVRQRAVFSADPSAGAAFDPGDTLSGVTLHHQRPTQQ